MVRRHDAKTTYSWECETHAHYLHQFVANAFAAWTGNDLIGIECAIFEVWEAWVKELGLRDTDALHIPDDWEGISNDRKLLLQKNISYCQSVVRKLHKFSADWLAMAAQLRTLFEAWLLAFPVEMVESWTDFNKTYKQIDPKGDRSPDTQAKSWELDANIQHLIANEHRNLWPTTAALRTWPVIKE